VLIPIIGGKSKGPPFLAAPMSIYGLVGPNRGLLRTGSKEAVSGRGLPRQNHHNSKASHENRNLIRHWITSFTLVEENQNMGQFAASRKRPLSARICLSSGDRVALATV
jgi:hypothetical protein